MKKPLPLGAAFSKSNGFKHYYGWLLLSSPDRLVNVVFNEEPSAVAPPMRATEMRAAIRPYSIAVAPDSSFMKRAKILDMELSYHNCCSALPDNCFPLFG